jgi:beta-N-acetylhexosaminidase
MKPSEPKEQAGSVRSGKGRRPAHRLVRLLLPLLWTTLIVVTFILSARWQPALQAQDEIDVTSFTSSPTLTPTLSPTLSATLSPMSSPSPTLTPTLTPNNAPVTVTPPTISITATIWAKASATAAAIQALTATPQPSPTPTPTPGPDQILDRQIEEMIAQMSVADRVGQLFIIDFEGSSIESNNDIAELIQEYRIGGVILSPQNENFSNQDPNAPRQIATLTNQLQALAYNITLPLEQALEPPELLLTRPNTVRFNLLQQISPNIPLFIGVEQDGDGAPSTSMRSGFTTLPPQMAIGASWQAEHAEAIGEIVGRELTAVGVNLLLGPNLDVFDQPRPEPVGGLGIYTFGGDSYWVGKLGQSYVRGVHTGGEGRVATIAGHFPGQGGSDRRPDEEVATIQKSLQELQQSELMPFASVTQRPSSLLRLDGDPAATDGLMSGHVRYSSFQGSRERTPPISLAKELGTILALEEFAIWRQGGGLVMSDALGVSSIRRYYDPTLQDFPSKRIALEAFLAGNDLLYLSNFSLTGNWEEARNNIRKTVIFFRERYTSDPDFAARVDSSLARILRLKLRLYANSGEGETQASPLEIPLTQVLTDIRSLRVLSGAPREEAQSIVSQVAREAITILYPDPDTLADPLPPAPQPDEKILIISDSRTYQECANCSEQFTIAPDALEGVMLRLYGPDATGQLLPEQLRSLTFEQLNALLNDTASVEETAIMEQAIDEANWLIFAMLDVDVARYQSSDAVKQFLRLRSDRLRSKRTVVLALNAPYFLDSTEISKLTAYLGVYSKTQPFLEAAVRTIFRAIQATGSSPVNVPGTRYSNLFERLEPAPDQTIELHLLNDAVTSSTGQGNGVPAERIQADLAIGDVIAVETGIILDHNGNPVPDGTMVNFRLIYEGAELALPVDPEPTQNGKARIAVPLERSGTLRISASSVEATISTLILVSTEGDNQAASIEFVMPTPTVEPTVEVAPAAVAINAAAPMTESAAVVASGASLAPQNPMEPVVRVNLLTLGLALITQLVMLGLLLVVLVRVMPRAMLVYRLLWALLVGWLAYIFYGLGLVPGSTWLQIALYPWGVIPVVFIGMLLPMVWLQLRAE